MREIDLINTGSKALLLDKINTCLENASVAVNRDEIVAVGDTKKILKHTQGIPHECACIHPSPHTQLFKFKVGLSYVSSSTRTVTNMHMHTHVLLHIGTVLYS